MAIRTDAGKKTGFGHVVRSLALARHLRERYGIESIFYSNPDEILEAMVRQNRFPYIANQGLSETEFLQQTARDSACLVLFIDKLYPYSRDTVRSLGETLKVVMFHNECAGMFECDYVVFPSAHLSEEVILDPRWSTSQAQFFYGFDYVIINESVISTLDQVRGTDSCPYIAITTGASDPTGMLVRFVEWINRSEIEVPVKALYGIDFCHRSELEALTSRLRPSIEVTEFNYADLFSAHLAISAFGVTTYELIYANIPVITIGHIRKNAHGSRLLQERYGCNYHLGMFGEVSEAQLLSAIHVLWNDKKRLSTIKRNQEGLMDGKGLDRLGRIIAQCYGG